MVSNKQKKRLRLLKAQAGKVRKSPMAMASDSRLESTVVGGTQEEKAVSAMARKALEAT